MPSDWYGSVTLVDHDSKKTTIRVVIGTITDVSFSAEAAEANSRFDAYITDLKAASKANVSKARLVAEDPGDWEDAGLPGAGVDISDEAVVNVHTNDTLFEKEIDQLRIPAPEETLFVNSEYAQGLDASDATLQAYVANYETDLMFSDGEHVNLAEGTNGIDSAQPGYWRSVKKSIK